VVTVNASTVDHLLDEPVQELEDDLRCGETFPVNAPLQIYRPSQARELYHWLCGPVATDHLLMGRFG